MLALTAIDWSTNSVRKGANVVIVGVDGPPFNLVDLGAAMNRGLTLRMNQANVKRSMPHLPEHIRAGRIDADADALFDEKRDGCIECVPIPPQPAAGCDE